MITRILPIALLSAVIISNTSCNSGGDFKKTHGIEYKIVKDAKGKNAAIGDVVELHIVAIADSGAKNDTFTLGNTRTDNKGMPVQMLADTPSFSGDYKAVLPMLSAGDSAIVKVSMDTIVKSLSARQQKLPDWMKPGGNHKITFRLSVVSIKSKEEFNKEREAKQAEMQKEMESKKAAQMPIDDKMLQDYFAQHNIKAEKTASGLYYTIQKPGSGAQIAKGQEAAIKYTGKTLDGKAFDSNVDTAVGHHGTDLLRFPVGQGQMIPGVDEGIALLKKGSKATLYLPSPLAYGPQSPSPNIGPNAILVFDVEVMDVKDAPGNK